MHKMIQLAIIPILSLLFSQELAINLHPVLWLLSRPDYGQFNPVTHPSPQLFCVTSASICFQLEVGIKLANKI